MDSSGSVRGFELRASAAEAPAHLRKLLLTAQFTGWKLEGSNSVHAFIVMVEPTYGFMIRECVYVGVVCRNFVSLTGAISYRDSPGPRIIPKSQNPRCKSTSPVRQKHTTRKRRKLRPRNPKPSTQTRPRLHLKSQTNSNPQSPNPLASEI